MKMLTKEDIKRTCEDRSHYETTVVQVPAWGGAVRIRSMGGDEVKKALSLTDEEDIVKTMPVRQAEYVAACCIEPAFDDVDEVLGMPYRGIRQLFKEIQRFTGAGGRDEDEPTLVDEAEGNSEATAS